MTSHNQIEASQNSITKNRPDLSQFDVEAANNINPETLSEDDKQNLHNEPSKKVKEEEDEGGFYNFLKKVIPLPGSLLTSALHLASSVASYFSFGTDLQKKIDKTALNTSKVILTGNCMIQAWEAFKKGRIWETIARIIEPIFIVIEKKTEDLGLARGMGLGISQFVVSQEGVLDATIDKYNIDKDRMNFALDHKMNKEACHKLLTDIVKGGIGKDRRFLTDLTFGNITKKVAEAFKTFKFSSFKELFSSKHKKFIDKFDAFIDKSGLGKIKELFAGSSDRDQGHTTALSGYLMTAGSLLGYIDKATKGTFYKLGGTLRNLGGAVADIGLFGHKDGFLNVSALLLAVNTVMDTVQRFIPESMQRLVSMWSNFSMAAYNVGVAIYLDRSSRKSDDSEEIKTYNSDAALDLTPEDLKWQPQARIA